MRPSTLTAFLAVVEWLEKIQGCVKKIHSPGKRGMTMIEHTEQAAVETTLINMTSAAADKVRELLTQ